jgi:hypothetical protein
MSDYDSSLPIRTETETGDVVSKIVDTAGTNQLEIDSTNRASVNINDGDGDELTINPDGSINTNVISTTVGTDVHEYATSAAVAIDTPTDVVSYTVTTAKTLLLKSVQAASSGKSKVEVKTGTPAAEDTVAVFFLSTSNGAKDFIFPQPIEVAGDDNVLVTMTNTENAQAQDLYAYINGVELP